MKKASINLGKEKVDFSHSECIRTARQLEDNNDLEEAAKLYRKCIRIKKADEDAYDRLMVIYRKKKEFNKELELINEAIAAFEKLYRESYTTAKTNNVIKKLSDSLLKATGLLDKKGGTLFKPQPILRWHKRAVLLQKRIEK